MFECRKYKSSLTYIHTYKCSYVHNCICVHSLRLENVLRRAVKHFLAGLAELQTHIYVYKPMLQQLRQFIIEKHTFCKLKNQFFQVMLGKVKWLRHIIRLPYEKTQIYECLLVRRHIHQIICYFIMGIILMIYKGRLKQTFKENRI